MRSVEDVAGYESYKCSILQHDFLQAMDANPALAAKTFCGLTLPDHFAGLAALVLATSNQLSVTAQPR